MDKIIVFKPTKIFNIGERKFLYSIEDSRLFEIDDKLEQILALSGHSVEELFNIFAKEKNIEIEETKNLCGGGCAYENYVENGSINIASADFCHHMELLYSAIIEIFIEKYYINVK